MLAETYWVLGHVAVLLAIMAALSIMFIAFAPILALAGAYWHAVSRRLEQGSGLGRRERVLAALVILFVVAVLAVGLPDVLRGEYPLGSVVLGLAPQVALLASTIPSIVAWRRGRTGARDHLSPSPE